MKKHLFFTLFLFLCYYSKAQFFTNKKIFAEVGAYFSTSSQAPFWIRSNQYGIVPYKLPNFQLRSGYKTEYDSTRYTDNNKLQKKIDYAFGIEMVGNFGKNPQILLPEAYFKTRLGILELYAGRRREVIGLLDTTLTTGSYIWSGNALPLPKLQISIPTYTSIIGKGLISVKGAFAHGRFGRQDIVRNYYLHQKNLYIKIGRTNQKFHFYGGMNLQVQWGGYNSNLVSDPTSSNKGYFASDFNTYLNIAVPFPIIRKAFPPKISIKNDTENYSGNMLGSVDFALDYDFSNLKMLFYKQTPYELGSLFSSLVNADDGLYGLSLKLKNNKIINKITIESFQSTNQGSYRSGIARLLNLEDRHFRESHNYFNHGQYMDGWQYNQNEIGTPLIPSNNHLAYPESNYLAFTPNNQVKAYFIGFQGKIYGVSYAIKNAFSTNYGKFNAPWGVIHQNVFSINITKPIIKYDTLLDLNLSHDSGQLYNKNLGFYIKLLKSW